MDVPDLRGKMLTKPDHLLALLPPAVEAAYRLGTCHRRLHLELVPDTQNRSWKGPVVMRLQVDQFYVLGWLPHCTAETVASMMAQEADWTWTIGPYQPWLTRGFHAEP